MIHSRKSQIIFCFLLFAFTGFAQQAILKGTITDEATDEPLYPATIKIGETGTISDLDGTFQLTLDPGTYQLEFSYIGFESVSQEVTLAANETQEIQISLTETVNLLQTATVTSGKYEKPLSEVTVSLEVLKSSLIENTNARSVADALEKVPGVNIVGGQANIRGGSGFAYGAGSRVLLLVNDLPALQADAGFPNWGDLPVESIEQVEVVKGAASALYGSAALNGIFNIRTAYARSEPETKLSLFGGIFDGPKDKEKKWWDDTKFETGLLFSHKQKINKLDLVLGGRLYYRDDPRETFQNKQARGTLGLRYRITDRLAVGFNMTYNTQKNRSYFYWLNGGEGVYQAEPSTFSRTNPTRFYIDPFVQYFDKGGNSHKFNGRFFSIDNPSETGTDNFSDLYYGEYQFQRRFEKIGLVTTAGIVGSHTDVRAPLYGDTSYVLTNTAAYLQLEKKVFEKVNLSAGIRYEYNEIKGPTQVGNFVFTEDANSDSRTIMRFGLNYQAHERTYIRGSWGQGFRFPTIAEKFITTDLGGTPISPNPELESETGWSAEIGIKQGISLSGWNGYLDLAGFIMEYDNMIEFVFTSFENGFQATNIGNTRIRGIDLSMAGQGKLFGFPTSILAGWTFIDPRFKDFDEANRLLSSVDYNILKYRFKHTIKIDVETKVRDFSLGLAMLRNSNMEAIDAIFETLVVPGLREYRAENNNGFYLFNVRASYQFNDHFKTSFLVNNLLNREYMVRPGLIEPTRLWSVRFDYKF